MVWYYHLFQNFPQFIVIHTVKGFGIVNKAEINVFLELSCFFDDTMEYYSAIKENEILTFVTTCMDLEEVKYRLRELWEHTLSMSGSRGT